MGRQAGPKFAVLWKLGVLQRKSHVSDQQSLTRLATRCSLIERSPKYSPVLVEKDDLRRIVRACQRELGRPLWCVRWDQGGHINGANAQTVD